jgi:hypothetical protein
VSLEKALFPFYFHMDVGRMMESVVYCLIWNKECLHIFCFYIISTILTFDVLSATSNSTIECYKTFMFRKRCTRFKMPTSSMVRNWSS